MLYNMFQTRGVNRPEVGGLASGFAFGGREQTVETFQEGRRQSLLPVRQDALARSISCSLRESVQTT